MLSMSNNTVLADAEMNVCAARCINDVLEYFGYLYNQKLFQEQILISTLPNCKVPILYLGSH